MAKVIIELDYYEDRDEIEFMIHSVDAYSALSQIDSKLRSRLKHDETVTPELERFYEQLRDICIEPLRYYR